jgi:hypothetical protein
MSSAAHQSLKPKQIEQLEKHATILSSSLDTIEACGGGSARCMMAEVFLPKLKKKDLQYWIEGLFLNYWLFTSDLFYYC